MADDVDPPLGSTPEPVEEAPPSEVTLELRRARGTAASVAVPTNGPTPPSPGLWGNAFRQLLRKRSAVVGLAMLTVLILTALFAPLLAPYGPNEVLLGEGAIPRDDPCIHVFGWCEDDEVQHVLGLDGNGRDSSAASCTAPECRWPPESARWPSRW